MPRSTSTASSRSASAPRPLPEGGSATALIAAAGSGERLGAGGPKALVEAAGRPLVHWSVAAFAAAPSVRAAVIAAPAGLEDEFRRAAIEAARSGELEVEVVSGGQTRAESVGAALAAADGDTVAVHDAARPLITADLIERLLTVLDSRPDVAGVIAAEPVADTLKRVADVEREIAATESRAGLWAAQTPQVFRIEALRRAHEVDAAALAAATDDASLVESQGAIVLVEAAGQPNLKVTTRADLDLVDTLLRR